MRQVGTHSGPLPNDSCTNSWQVQKHLHMPPICAPPLLPLARMLQSTDQFFLFPLLWTTQYTARSTASSAYKYSTCTRTSCPAHIVLTACPTCLQPVPYQPPPSIQCHRLLRTTPRLCPVTAASGKPTSPTSATFRRRDVQPYPRR